MIAAWILLIALLGLGFEASPAVASTHPVAQHTCPRLKAVAIYKGERYTCVRSGKKLEWTTGVTAAKTPTTTTTPAQAAGEAVAAGCAAAYEFPVLTEVPGAGSGYAKPSVKASCSNGELSVASNGMISYPFTPTTPNPLLTQSWVWKVPTAPKVASTTTSLVNVMGAIGFTVSGLPIYGPEEGAQPSNEAYGDPVANKILDSCGGHTGPAGEYHYHEIIATSACHLSSSIIGYAFDGFPIYPNPSNVYKSGYEETGTPTTNSWDAYTYVGGASDVLDRCNGTTVDGRYRYYVTSTFPYVLGCYTGTPEVQPGGGAMAARSIEVFSNSNALTDEAVNAYARDCG
jgi:hypothetical protein